MSLPEHFDWEPPDPPVDESVAVRCVAPGCEQDVTWHPEVMYEYQGEVPHGGATPFYTDDAFDCPECGAVGEEVA